jgi:hypothetical protein
MRARALTAALDEATCKAWWTLADADANDSLSAKEAAAFLTRTGLSRAALARIWCAGLASSRQCRGLALKAEESG